MSNYDFVAKRKREQHLFIVEGNHEKDKLLNLLLQCFPEMNIKSENIIVYETNIYVLYSKLISEYGEEWAETDVDLPYIVSKMKNSEVVWNKRNFINIFLIFDYERQDTYFSETDINKMQQYFIDETDSGKLYINYPMVESYCDSFDSQGEPFERKKVMLPFKTGSRYKNHTEKSEIAQAVNFPQKLDSILKGSFDIKNSDIRANCIRQLLDLKESSLLIDDIEKILNGRIDKEYLETAKNLIKDKIIKVGYTELKSSYIEFMRRMICEIIRYNIRKANLIQNGKYDVQEDKLKDVLYELDPIKILGEQNKCSRDMQNGFIWVLNTSVLIVPYYSFHLLEND